MSDKLESCPATLQGQVGRMGDSRERWEPQRTTHKANTHAPYVPSHANTEGSKFLFGNAGLRSASSSGAVRLIFI